MRWCKTCHKEVDEEYCEICGSKTEQDIPCGIYWCKRCKIPIIKMINSIDKDICPICNEKTEYLSTDLRPVFPEERLLLEILLDKPMEYLKSSVWATNNRYIIDGRSITITSKYYKKYTSDYVCKQLDKYRDKNFYKYFNKYIEKFVEANIVRINYLVNEAFDFIKSVSNRFLEEQIIISFLGGKDSTVTADLATRALGNPSLVHIFGNTTLEFPLTIEYVKKFRKEHPFAIFKTAVNKDQNFIEVCKDIGPPARVMRWCCSMFKTGPITKVINSLYGDKQILTFYGIRKTESVNRSKYNRIA